MRLRKIMSNFVQSYPCFWELDKIGQKKAGQNWTSPLPPTEPNPTTCTTLPPLPLLSSRTNLTPNWTLPSRCAALRTAREANLAECPWPLEGPGRGCTSHKRDGCQIAQESKRGRELFSHHTRGRGAGSDKKARGGGAGEARGCTSHKREGCTRKQEGAGVMGKV